MLKERDVLFSQLSEAPCVLHWLHGPALEHLTVPPALRIPVAGPKSLNAAQFSRPRRVGVCNQLGDKLLESAVGGNGLFARALVHGRLSHGAVAGGRSTERLAGCGCAEDGGCESRNESLESDHDFADLSPTELG